MMQSKKWLPFQCCLSTDDASGSIGLKLGTVIGNFVTELKFSLGKEKSTIPQTPIQRWQIHGPCFQSTCILEKVKDTGMQMAILNTRKYYY